MIVIKKGVCQIDTSSSCFFDEMAGPSLFWPQVVKKVYDLFGLLHIFLYICTQIKSINMSIWVIFTLLGSLALLMFGMKTMSEALQKMAGPQLRHVLGAMTTNRFTGMLTGTLVTASVQSSTATTVMTVSFVNAGLLTLAQAISVIMGANIGTTLTAWIMSAGMSFDVSSLSYPAFFVGIILIYQKKYRYIGDFLFGIAFLIFALAVLRKTGQDMHLGENQAVLDCHGHHDDTLLQWCPAHLSGYCIGDG